MSRGAAPYPDRHTGPGGPDRAGRGVGWRRHRLPMGNDPGGIPGPDLGARGAR